MFGLRPDGKRIKNLDPIQKIMPHIMKDRHDSMNLASYECPCEPIDAFIKEQKAIGQDVKYMHIVIASIVRTIALYPRLNRFIMNGRIYKRDKIYISFIVKKNLSQTASDATVKLAFTGHEGLYEIRDKINEAIRENSKISNNTGTDKAARLLTVTPNFLIKFLVGVVKLLDKHGMLPGKVLALSPFHTSCFVTNLKSIKGPSIYHHVYDFGTTGLFVAMGKESMKPVVRDGEIVLGKLMPLDYVTDERFCDGFYFVNALKKMKAFYADPSQMIEPLEELPQDVDVINSRKENKKLKKAKKEEQKDNTQE